MKAAETTTEKHARLQQMSAFRHEWIAVESAAAFEPYHQVLIGQRSMFMYTQALLLICHEESQLQLSNIVDQSYSTVI